MAPGLAHVFGDEVDESMLTGVLIHEFADGPHEDEHDQSDQDIDQDDGGAGQGDGLARSQEEAGADGPADGDELDVPVAQSSFHGVMGIQLFHGVEGTRP